MNILLMKKNEVLETKLVAIKQCLIKIKVSIEKDNSKEFTVELIDQLIERTKIF